MQSMPNPPYPQQSPLSLPQQKKKNPNKPLIIVIIAAAALLLGVLLLAGGAGGFCLYTQHYYGLAEASIAKQDYAAAVEDLGRVVRFYKDSHKLMKYAQACQALDGGNFYGAKKLLEGLYGFRNASALAHEADYQQAQAMLKDGDFKGAKALLDPLAADSYKDSADLAREATYNMAVSAFKAGKYANALPLFNAEPDYRDSPDYIFLSQMLLKQYGSLQYSNMKANCQRLISLSGMNSAMDALKSDALIQYLLEGSWKTASVGSDGWYFTMTHNDVQNDWNISYNMPWVTGTYFKIKDSVCLFGSNADGWRNCYSFKFLSADEMIVYCYKDDSSHLLYRQK